MGKPAFIPLGGTAGARLVPTSISPAAGIQQLHNVVPLVYTENITGKKKLKIVSRNGFDTLLVAEQSGFSFTRGMIWTGVQVLSGTFAGRFTKVLAAHDGSNVRLYSFDATGLHTLGTFVSASQCFGLQETIISTVPNITVVIRLAASPYTQKVLFFPSGGALTDITDGDFPTNTIGNPVHMDGYMFIMDRNGNIWNSDLNSLANWTSTSFIAASATPGTGIGLSRIGNLIVAFKVDGIEFFENVGNASGSPLQRVAQYAKEIGALHCGDIMKAGETVLFVASSTKSGVGVYQLSGSTPKKISTPWIDRYLAMNASFDNLPYNNSFLASSGSFFLGIAIFNGLQVALLQVNRDGSLPTIFGYVVGTEDTWIVFTYLAATNTRDIPCVFSSDSVSFLLWSGRGVMYTDATSTTNLTTDRDTNAAVAIFPWKIVTEPISLGTGRKKTINKAWYHCDQQLIAGNVLLEYSDDDGANFITAGNFDVSKSVDQSALTGLGTSSRRIWRLSSSTVPSLSDALEVDYTGDDN